MGGGFCIKTVTRYTPLYDVYVFLWFALCELLLKRIKFWGKGKIGIKGVNSLCIKTHFSASTLYVIFTNGLAGSETLKE